MNYSALEEKEAFSGQAFQRAIKRLVKKDNLFKTWFSKTQIEELENGELLLRVQSQLALDWIKRRYWSEIQKMVENQWQTNIKIVANDQEVDELLKPQKRSPLLKMTGLAKEPVLKSRPKNRSGFEFKEFISGPENQLALVAAQAVGDKKEFHSPLTIVGEAGMGKTHLSSCIADQWPEVQVLHWHAEEFSNAYIQAVREGNLDQFRARIRSKAIVVIEDIDFLLEGQKRKTIDELMNSFKVLKRERRHIVVTTSQPVYKFEESCPKLAQFLLAGLKVKLHTPSSMSIKKLVEFYTFKHDLKLSPKSQSFIESIAFRSPRDIFGALQQVKAYSALGREALSLHVVKDILSDHVRFNSEKSSSAEELDLHSIAGLVTKLFGVQLPKLVSKTRERHVSLARHTAMSLSYENHFTLKEIGNFYGGRQHQSVLFATNKVKEKLEKDLDYRKCYVKLEREVKSMTHQ